MTEIPFLRPNLVSKDDYLDLLAEIDASRIYSNYGPMNDRFEQRLTAELFDGTGRLTTVNNATTGLILAISRCKRPGGKYALMPSFTFPAAPLAALWCGLEPYFIDIRQGDWCMDETKLEEAVTLLAGQAAVIVPYAAFGTCMDLSAYSRWLKSGIPVVVDAAASIGSSGRHGQFGKGFEGAVIYSFHATKTFGIGEGGLVYSADEELIADIRRASNFGFSDARESAMQGMNGKLPEYAAAVGLATLARFNGKIAERQRVSGLYLKQLSKHGLMKRGWRMQKVSGRIAPSFLPVLCPENQQNTVYLKGLADLGVQARSYFHPACHEQLMFRHCPSGTLETTEQISGRILSLPLWEEMKTEHVERIVQEVDRFERACYLGMRGSSEGGS
ncbi:aminotransferase class I/II-fold pyridoxal phosphate-dependent enzyme [Paenibacillus sp. sptzw28]|uniref:DegT/DnrJ/EryC1/StrS family aminotransferase n=1 Tax=Paenibacillus sp. sptzw28 TaxID=715179 RepID=UPI001C6F2130|nr:aminotransferase class I/II-fold pyridoxal phosphate-dependent enzyme [Paenibacillus sp. sptzw28]QYR19857.1 aminotransferase class I/II-fold pyridoxal phosphate-dependent enzyme [Paenibacillus sp. sptzw28]